MNAVGVKLGSGWYNQEQYVPPSASEPTYGKEKNNFINKLTIKITFRSSSSYVCFTYCF